jgi:hypothetical protein
MAEGRIEVKWFHIMDQEDAEKACVTETLFVRDYLDQQRLD